MKREKSYFGRSKLFMYLRVSWFARCFFDCGKLDWGGGGGGKEGRGEVGLREMNVGGLVGGAEGRFRLFVSFFFRLFVSFFFILWSFT